MKKFSDLEDLYPRPAGYDGQKNGTPTGDHIQDQLTDNTVTEAYKVAWKPWGHLKDATDDVTDAVWGIQDGRRNVRQQEYIPNLEKGKK